MELYNAAESRVYQNVTRTTRSEGEIRKNYFLNWQSAKSFGA